MVVWENNDDDARHDSSSSSSDYSVCIVIPRSKGKDKNIYVTPTAGNKQISKLISINCLTLGDAISEVEGRSRYIKTCKR